MADSRWQSAIDPSLPGKEDVRLRQHRRDSVQIHRRFGSVWRSETREISANSNYNWHDHENQTLWRDSAWELHLPGAYQPCVVGIQLFQGSIRRRSWKWLPSYTIKRKVGENVTENTRTDWVSSEIPVSSFSEQRFLTQVFFFYRFREVAEPVPNTGVVPMFGRCLCFSFTARLCAFHHKQRNPDSIWILPDFRMWI